ncbi:hypothetical protein J6590_009397 [Homalodisca vitripennis]|nr:hypothetical protein J6590_009397 [Homalodisca vitripennis]
MPCHHLDFKCENEYHPPQVKLELNTKTRNKDGSRTSTAAARLQHVHTNSGHGDTLSHQYGELLKVAASGVLERVEHARGDVMRTVT